MTIKSILPNHYSDTEHALDAVFADRLEAIPDIGDPWNVDECPDELLMHLAYQESVDIWDDLWPPQVKRDVIKASREVHRIKGTVKSIRLLLEAAGYGEAEIIEGRVSTKADGTYKADGVKTCGNIETWTENIFIFTKPISNRMADKFTILFDNVSPARSILYEIRYHRTIKCDGEIKADGTYKAGSFVNG